MIDPVELKRANEAFDRIRDLDAKGAANARAFRCYLEDLNGRNCSLVCEPHKTAIEIMRAAVLRSTIGALLSCLDTPDKRDNRASVGQILTILEEPGVFAVWQPKDAGALGRIRADYDALLLTDRFGRCKELRNTDIAHLLMLPTRTVEYTDIYSLNDAAEQMVVELCRFVRIVPECVAKRAHFEMHAKLFWDTHFKAVTNA